MLEDDDIGLKVLSKTSQETVQLCNAECYDTNDCATYRYNKQSKECILMTADYRKDCNIQAGPVVRSFGSILFYRCYKAYTKIPIFL